jgi:hypothetical protein
MTNQSALAAKEIHQIVQLKRTGENEPCWLPLPKDRYLFNSSSGSVVYEGDELLGNTNDFQICQSCQEAYPVIGLKNICPHCGYDIDKEIAIREKELELIELNRKSADAYLHAINTLAWELLTQKNKRQA